MRNFIRDKLNVVYSDFCHSAQNSNGLCPLKEFSFRGRNSPDYSDPLVRQYYMLKFFPGYLAEYYLMYRYLLNLEFVPNDHIEILSLGFGAGIDYWGFYFAAMEVVGEICFEDFTYTGLDINDWEYRDRLGNAGIYFEDQDVGGLDVLDYDGYNVIVFPKSISDFPDGAFDALIGAIRQTNFRRGKIAILCSLMTNESRAYDNSRLRRIVSVFVDDLGYECLDDLNEYIRMREQNVGLNTLVGGFDYSLNINETIMKTLEKCPNYIANGKSCDAGCSSMNTYPILRTNYVNYAIRRLSKE